MEWRQVTAEKHAGVTFSFVSVSVGQVLLFFEKSTKITAKTSFCQHVHAVSILKGFVKPVINEAGFSFSHINDTLSKSYMIGTVEALAPDYEWTRSSH